MRGMCGGAKQEKIPHAGAGFLVGDGGFGPPKSETTDLQSAPFGHSGNPPYGAGEGNRTPNLLITNQLLCQLSYTSISAVLYHAALRFFLPSALRRMILYHFAVLLSIPFCDFFRTFEKNLFAAALTQLLYYFNVSKDMAISISEGKFNFYSTDFVKYNNTSFLVMPEKA